MVNKRGKISLLSPLGRTPHRCTDVAKLWQQARAVEAKPSSAVPPHWRRAVGQAEAEPREGAPAVACATKHRSGSPHRRTRKQQGSLPLFGPRDPPHSNACETHLEELPATEACVWTRWAPHPSYCHPHRQSRRLLAGRSSCGYVRSSTNNGAHHCWLVGPVAH